MYSEYEYIILYGSETGNAEDLSFKLYRDHIIRNVK